MTLEPKLVTFCCKVNTDERAQSWALMRVNKFRWPLVVFGSALRSNNRIVTRHICFELVLSYLTKSFPRADSENIGVCLPLLCIVMTCRPSSDYLQDNRWCMIVQFTINLSATTGTCKVPRKYTARSGTQLSNDNHLWIPPVVLAFCLSVNISLEDLKHLCPLMLPPIYHPHLCTDMDPLALSSIDGLAVRCYRLGYTHPRIHFPQPHRVIDKFYLHFPSYPVHQRHTDENDLWFIFLSLDLLTFLSDIEGSSTVGWLSSYNVRRCVIHPWRLKVFLSTLTGTPL